MKKDLLPKVTNKGAKRIGRGPGSGKGKTSGRGTKGQNARGRLTLTHSHFEGGQRPLIKRLPYMRGKGNSKISSKPIIVNLDSLNNLKANQVVDLEFLIKNGIVKAKDAKKFGVKVLGKGNLKVALTITVPISKRAQEKTTKSQGKIFTHKNDDK
ncbi:MAG: 50S ribosomal protein L15 [Patescibacteria group bacterium]